MELHRFRKGERKDDVMQRKLRWFKRAGRTEGVVFVGVAQENARIPRTARKQLAGGGTIPWITYAKQPVNRLRYVLMLNEMGAIIDDGVACRFAEDHFYVTTTTTGSDRVYQTMLWWNAKWRLDVDIACSTLPPRCCIDGGSFRNLTPTIVLSVVASPLVV